MYVLYVEYFDRPTTGVQYGPFLQSTVPLASPPPARPLDLSPSRPLGRDPATTRPRCTET